MVVRKLELRVALFAMGATLIIAGCGVADISVVEDLPPTKTIPHSDGTTSESKSGEMVASPNQFQKTTNGYHVSAGAGTVLDGKVLTTKNGYKVSLEGSSVPDSDTAQ